MIDSLEAVEKSILCVIFDAPSPFLAYYAGKMTHYSGFVNTLNCAIYDALSIKMDANASNMTLCLKQRMVCSNMHGRIPA